jgi:hypothetical protein
VRNILYVITGVDMGRLATAVDREVAQIFYQQVKQARATLEKINVEYPWVELLIDSNTKR